MWFSTGPHLPVPVDHSSQIGRIRRDAMGLAREIGLKTEDIERVGIVATEIASNIVKFGGAEGSVLIGGDHEAAAVELIGLDRGPGIADPERWFADKASTAGTLGTGLGAIRRLSDAFDLHTALGEGTVLFARIEGRRAPSGRPSGGPSAISVPARDQTECGDGWMARRRGDRTL
ncbi:MAG: ATP-binding protein, partial [Alphaproteobacteria bacterium]|nr:ATP-binding protein [Alphaproteobacteria bacterium]